MNLDAAMSLAVAIACAPAGGLSDPAARARAAVGSWGGEHVRLEATASGGEIEFDCAHGVLDEPIAPDEDGRFAAKGLYTREHSGPIRPGLEPRAEPASYAGTIDRGRMTLRVTVAGSSEPVGTYTLTLGGAAKVRKCR